MTNISSDSHRLTIGFVVNPIAGVGGPAGLKGSDSGIEKARLNSGELKLRAPQRVKRFLDHAHAIKDALRFVTAHGVMGESHLASYAFEYFAVECDIPHNTLASHTQQVVRAFRKLNVDLIVFVGGDGTARDVFDVIGYSIPVLGIPSGVKMHSSVFALNPEAAADLIAKIVCQQNEEYGIVNICDQEVRDIDEALLQKGIVKSRHYGDMIVPFDDQFIQSVKQGGGETDELSLVDISAEIRQRIRDLDHPLIIFAPGTTNQFIQNELGFSGTLLGVDVVKEGCVIYSDANAIQIEEIVTQHQGDIKIVVTPIGGQGYLFGRGNQQLTPNVLRRVRKENVWVVATPRKLQALERRAFLLDTNDTEIDRSWSGVIPVITGYQQQVLYRVRC